MEHHIMAGMGMGCRHGGMGSRWERSESQPLALRWIRWMCSSALAMAVAKRTI